MAAYQEMGYQVHLEDVNPAACFQEPRLARRYKIIFTRPTAPALML